MESLKSHLISMLLRFVLGEWLRYFIVYLTIKIVTTHTGNYSYTIDESMMIPPSATIIVLLSISEMMQIAECTIPIKLVS